MLLLIDKPKGITSHDVVNQLRKITGERKIGHAGTLDPNATGLLIVGVGRESTKKLGTISKDTFKIYEAEIILGEERDTDDAEGKIIKQTQNVNNVHDLTKRQIEAVFKTFLGKQKQVPPAYSAIKLKGKKAYELARKGKSLNLDARDIEILSIEVVSFKYPSIELVTKVSSGTYIRSLARDIGRKLGVGGYLSELRRTQIGMYKIEDAVKLADLSKDNWKKYALN